MKEKKSKMPQIGEACFCIIYLVFAFASAAYMLSRAGGRAPVLLYGLLTLVLAGGDSFHLVPRILNAFRDEFPAYEFYAGLGLMVSSITMTVFYLILHRVWVLLYMPAVQAAPVVIWLLYGCAFVRIALCFAPQNNWFKKEGNQTWGILRNIPFIVVGLIMIWLFWIAGNWSMAAAILISFACYLPVVLLAKKNPKIGMLMMPKTMAYMWMISMGLAMV